MARARNHVASLAIATILIAASLLVPLSLLRSTTTPVAGGQSSSITTSSGDNMLREEAQGVLSRTVLLEQENDVPEETPE
eukprot:scaffold485314_cov52-Prasinocladus_malaysianus.AAC.1